jgi:hypothetical protein
VDGQKRRSGNKGGSLVACGEGGWQCRASGRGQEPIPAPSSQHTHPYQTVGTLYDAAMPRQGHCDERGAREKTAHIPGDGSEGPRVPTVPTALTALFLAAMLTHEASVRLVAAMMEVWYKKWRDDDGGPGQADVKP